VAIPVIEISDGDLLYRRLAPSHLNSDGSVNSNAFKLNGKPDPQISVDLAKLATIQEALSRAQGSQFRIGIIQAAHARQLGLTVRHDPLDDNPAHSVIEGNTTKANCRDLASKTRLASS
jgi:hypothetical protein